MRLTKFARAQFFVGVLLLLTALTFYYFAVLRIDYTKTTLIDLAPHPDATEYFAQAQALRRDGWPSIQIGYEHLPSRYPSGYPVLTLLWLKILPEADAVLAPFRTSQMMGLLLLLAVFVFYAYLTMPLVGGLAALLLATLPGFFSLSRSSLSEVSASLLITLAFMFAYLGVTEERRWKIYLSAFLLGLSLNVRLQSIFFAPLLLVAAVFPIKGLRLRWLVHCAAVPFVFILAASPVLVLNTIQFHSPFKTGYDFWTPFFNEKHILFLPRYIPTNAVNLWKQATLQPHSYDAANIFGTGASFVPAFVLLTCVGFILVRLTWFVACAFLAGMSSFAASLCYLFGRDGRFYLPLLILLVAVAVLPVGWAVNQIVARKQMVAAAAIFALFTVACLGYPSRSGYNTPGIDRSQAWDAFHFATSPSKSMDFIAQRYLATRLSQQGGIVLSDIDPVYLNALLPRSFIAAPIDGKHHYKWSYIWHYDRPQAMALVEHGLQQRVPVYALFTSEKDLAMNRSRLPNVAGYEWHDLESATDNPTILKLAPAGSDQTAAPSQ